MQSREQEIARRIDELFSREEFIKYPDKYLVVSWSVHFGCWLFGMCYKMGSGWWSVSPFKDVVRAQEIVDCLEKLFEGSPDDIDIARVGNSYYVKKFPKSSQKRFEVVSGEDTAIKRWVEPEIKRWQDILKRLRIGNL